METIKTNYVNGAVEQLLPDIEPDVPEEKTQPSAASYTLDDIITEDNDDALVTGNSLDHIEVRRPGRQEWFRAHPSWQLSTRVVILKQGTKETVYLIHKSVPVVESLEQDSVPARIQVCANLKGKIFVWVIRKSKEEGSLSKHYAKALEHIELARTKWIRRFWLDDQSTHVVREANITNEPAWPDASFQDVIVAGFGSRLITTLDSPILKELRGGADA